jgi:Domain of unknown function (DUF1839)
MAFAGSRGAPLVTRQLWAIDPATYRRHPLHAVDRVWLESNCSIDLWTELLHTAGMEPRAALPCAFRIDFEGDQWTLITMPHADLLELYGIDVIELNVWRPLVSHIDDQLELGRPTIVDVDAFYLPDTAGITHGTEHLKTSIAIQAMDRDCRRLGYFHNAGYFELEGDDFEGILSINDAGTDRLAPHVEVAKFAAEPQRDGRALIAASVALLRAHVAHCPDRNPFHRYAEQFSNDLESLVGQPLGRFHAYAFATLRQCGAAFDLGCAYLRWLQSHGEAELEQIATNCDVIASTAKALQLKTARFVNTGRAFDPSPLLDTMAVAWETVMDALTARYGALVHQG